MMKQLFPLRQVMGFVYSLLLSIVALSVVYFDMSYATGITILLITAFIQASMQLVVFMHIGEDSTKTALYLNIAYAAFVGLVTIFGTLFTMIWGW